MVIAGSMKKQRTQGEQILPGTVGSLRQQVQTITQNFSTYAQDFMKPFSTSPIQSLIGIKFAVVGLVLSSPSQPPRALKPIPISIISSAEPGTRQPAVYGDDHSRPRWRTVLHHTFGRQFRSRRRLKVSSSG